MRDEVGALQNIISSAKRATVESAETHRLVTISNIENALHHGGFDDEQEQRLKRLLAALERGAGESSQRKFAIVSDVVIPTLISMGLVEEL